MLGIVFTLISSALFGVTTVLLRRGTVAGSAGQGLVITVIGGVPLFLIAALVSGQIFSTGDITGRGYAALTAAGVIHFLIGRYCTFRAYAAIGANRSSPVLQGTALLSVLFALTFLDEAMTPLKAVGIGLIFVGPALAASSPQPQRAPAGASEDAEVPARLLEGYGFAALGTLMFGVSPILIRFALEDSGGLGVLGGLVSYAAAAAILAPIALFSGQASGALNLDRGTQVWFLSGGLTIFLGHMFRFLALSLAPVTIVIPLLRSQTIFALALGYVVNRRYENFHPRTLAGVAAAVAGSLALVA